MKHFTQADIDNICEKFGFSQTVCTNEPNYGDVTIQIGKGDEVTTEYIGEFKSVDGNLNEFAFELYKP